MFSLSRTAAAEPASTRRGFLRSTAGASAAAAAGSALAGATPAADAPKPFYREEHHPEDAAFVRSLDLPELRVLFDGLTLIDETVTNIVNRPMTSGGLSDWFEAMSERCSDVRAYAVEEMQRRPMTGDWLDDEQTIAYVAAWDLKHCGAHLLETLPTLIRMKTDSDTAAHERAKAK